MIFSSSATSTFTIVNYNSISATAFLVWDILITLDDEVRLIWPKPKSFRAKWLFLLIRYYAVVFQLSLMFDGTSVAKQLHYTPRACTIWFLYQTIGAELLSAAVEILIIMRVRALYQHNVIITRALYALFSLEIVSMVIANVLSARNTTFDATCFIIHTPFSFLLGVLIGGFEILLFALTLAKSVRELYGGWRDEPFLTVIVRDGAWAFALLFAAICINLGIRFGAPGGKVNAVHQWIFSIESFAGTRLILNMLALEGPPADDCYDSQSQFATIRFAAAIPRQEGR